MKTDKPDSGDVRCSPSFIPEVKRKPCLNEEDPGQPHGKIYASGFCRPCYNAEVKAETANVEATVSTGRGKRGHPEIPSTEATQAAAPIPEPFPMLDIPPARCALPETDSPGVVEDVVTIDTAEPISGFAKNPEAAETAEISAAPAGPAPCLTGCSQPAKIRGLCHTCYDRARQKGDLEQIALPRKNGGGRRKARQAEPKRRRKEAAHVQQPPTTTQLLGATPADALQRIQDVRLVGPWEQTHNGELIRPKWGSIAAIASQNSEGDWQWGAAGERGVADSPFLACRRASSALRDHGHMLVGPDAEI